jgi:GNAT superfamily N-acetyltransferase
VQIEPRPLDDPDVQALVEEVQLEYVHRYGGPDHTELRPEEFAPPRGLFLVVRSGAIPLGIGGWRAQDSKVTGLQDGDAEIKRMYVRAEARRRGIARRVLDALERTAADAGRRRMVLETGTAQPEALAMYAAAGYEPLNERFGVWGHSESSRYFSKKLPRISLAKEIDLPVLQDIERAAGRPFAEIGMALIADDEPPPLSELREYVDAGRCWVGYDESDHPIAYLTATVIDDAAHIEQVSVHPEHSRRGVGRGLIDHAAGWARDGGYSAATLTTYRDVAWNAPYYARLGFEILDDAHLTPGLRGILADEAQRGLGRWPRVAMRRMLD